MNMSITMAMSFSTRASFHPPHIGKSKCLESVRSLVKTLKIPSLVSSPPESLLKGNWVKLICGASFEDVADIRNMSLVYTLAGVDCIDCAADESVVRATEAGIAVAQEIAYIRRPWIMISVNDDEDLHFRKAEFDPEDCPPDCLRPCEAVCPADAISFPEHHPGGVITERCYGCGRCFPVCPYDKIRAVNYIRDKAAVSSILKLDAIDALEIHTSGSHLGKFKELWDGLGKGVENLKLVAVSLPYSGDATVPSMKKMYSIMMPELPCYNLWQLDGRPMSGDIGRGASKELISFAAHVANSKDRPPGFYQVAGGSNAHTVAGLQKEGLYGGKVEEDPFIGGLGFGSYARKIVGRVLRSVPSENGAFRLEDHPEHLLEAVVEALRLVGTVKCYAGSLPW